MRLIRREGWEDLPLIRRINEEAFGRKEEADLVDALRKYGGSIISLVAVQDEEVVGHILFSPVRIESGSSGVRAAGLGPMAVLPAHQKKGIGSKLVKRGLEESRKAGYKIIFVLGHPGFYPRFGFMPAKQFGICPPWDVPDDVFMALEIFPGALAKSPGIVRYLSEFTRV